MRTGFVSLLCAVVLSCAAAAKDPTRAELTMRLPWPQDGLLELVIVQDGKLIDGEFETFLAKVLRHFDRDQDGSWDAAEAERVFSFPSPTGKLIAFDFAAADRNRDQKIQLVELQTWKQEACLLTAAPGASPGVPGQTVADDERLSNIFAAACDADRNGLVTLAELQTAPRRLQRSDLNDDEILDWKELLAAPAAPEREVKYPKAKRIAPLVILRFGAQPSAELPKDDKANQLLVSGSRFVLQPADGTCMIGGKLQRELPDLNTVTEFLVAQLEEASGGEGALLKSVAVKEESLRGLLDLFSYADRNGDERLTAVELRDYLTLLAEGLQSQYVVRLHDRDQNWFSLLDADGDSRLTPLELSRLRHLLLLSDGQIGRFLELEVGTVPVTVWGGVRIPAAARTKSKTKLTDRSKLPAWFVAQDHNADDVVSSREFLGPISRFRELDKNADDLLEPAEALISSP